MEQFETVEVTTDLLIIGGGMAACGAAVEAAYWAKKHNLKVTVVDKAAMDRSGAVAMGLSALNQYVGMKAKGRTPEDYVRYVRNDLMGITRDDLVFDIARHVDGSVHLFEKWGLPIWKDASGNYVFEANRTKSSFPRPLKMLSKRWAIMASSTKGYLSPSPSWTATVLPVPLGSAPGKIKYMCSKQKP
jgi:succinate dehydrogenase/fumarate reductase flavoprotein subunit